MLHRGASLYRAERNDDLLKVKTYDDAEARVIAHMPGKGKYAGLLGALLVETPAAGGQPAGASSSAPASAMPQRRQSARARQLGDLPLQRLNDSGMPRFASFMRVREDMRVLRRGSRLFHWRAYSCTQSA